MKPSNIVGLGMLAWIGYILWKNHSTDSILKELRKDVTDLKKKLSSQVKPSIDGMGDTNHLNFVDQPCNLITLYGTTPDMKKEFDMQCNAHITPAPDRVYENWPKDN